MTTINQGGRFEIARVPQALFGVLGRNFVPFLILAIVLIGIPATISQLSNNYLAGHPGEFVTTTFLRLITAVLALVGSFIMQAAVVGGTISDLNGRKQTLGEMVSGKAGFVLPLLGLAILQGLATGLATLLFIVPGIILLCVWLVTVPAVVIDKTGVMSAFGRSAELTKGHRWSIFLLVLVYFIAAMILGSVEIVLMGGLAGAAATARLGISPLAMGYTIITNILIGMVSATAIPVIYYELRRAREGVAPQALADTFS